MEGSMKNIREIDLKNKELGKLVEFAYLLREGEYEDIYFPTYEFYDGCGMDYGVETEKGGIMVYCNFADHSTVDLATIICVFEGAEDNPEKAYYLSTTTGNYRMEINKLVLTEDKNHFTDDIESLYKMSKQEKIDCFIDAMVMLGFRKADIEAVLEKKMTAREAYRNVALEEKKNIVRVSHGRRIFYFDKNVAIKGDFGGIWLDEFPFPFEEEPIFDCSKVICKSAYFNDNPRGIKLINVNANEESIRYTDLTNVKIDEVIDLSKVNATGTTFGHHKVINLDYSIAPLERVNLSLATDIDGNNYITTKTGLVTADFQTEDVMERKQGKIKVYANADNSLMTMDALEHGADGIGLIRTENIYTDEKEALKRFVYYAENTYTFEPVDSNTEFNNLQYTQLKEICTAKSISKKIVRLFDFKEEDVQRILGVSRDSEDHMTRRNFLSDYHGILRDQIFTIAKVAEEENTTFDILVPMVTDANYFHYIKSDIISYAEDAGMKNLKIGAMMESKDAIPAIPSIAKSADFISIGTNDLTESITGKRRNIYDKEFFYLTEDVKGAIEDIVYRAKAVNPDITIGICGEHANYLENVEYYGTLNIDYITCSTSFIEVNKKILNPIQKVKNINRK